MANDFNCPKCGARLGVSAKSATPSVQGGWSKLQSYNYGDTAPTFQEYIKTTPAREPTTSGDVAVPLLQAAITGALTFGVAGLFVYIRHLSVLWAAAAGLCMFAGAWAYLLSDHRALLRITEIITNEPTAQPEPTQQMRLEVTERKGNGVASMRFDDLPCDTDVFQHIARGVLAGAPFSERRWAGSISGPKFRILRDKLLKAKYIRWASDKDHRQGVALTRKGADMFREAIK